MPSSYASALRANSSISRVVIFVCTFPARSSFSRQARIRSPQNRLKNVRRQKTNRLHGHAVADQIVCLVAIGGQHIILREAHQPRRTDRAASSGPCRRPRGPACPVGGVGGALLGVDVVSEQAGRTGAKPSPRHPAPAEEFVKRRHAFTLVLAQTDAASDASSAPSRLMRLHRVRPRE
jgi:hypothetical protein